MNLSNREILDNMSNNEERINYIKSHGRIISRYFPHVDVYKFKISKFLREARNRVPINKELVENLSNEISEKIIENAKENINKSVKDIATEINYHKLLKLENVKKESINVYVLISSFYSEEDSFISDAYTGNMEDGRNINICLNEKFSAKDFLENKEYFKYALTSCLIHEMTHAIDIDKKENYSEKGDEIYFNSEKELKAIVNEIIRDIELKNIENVSKNLIEILKFNDVYQHVFRFLNDDGKKYILQSLYNYFNKKESDTNK